MADPIQMQVDVLLQEFRFNEIGLRQTLAGPQGPVVQDLIRRAIRVESAAKENASQPPPSIPGTGPSVRTGRLRGSITWRLGSDPSSAYADIGSAVHYAVYVELGTSRMEARPYLRPALDHAR